jgi:hypothetical protein
MQNPNTRAGDLVGDAAISANSGDPNAPASAFVAMWRTIFNKTAQKSSIGPGTLAGGQTQPGVQTVANAPIPAPAVAGTAGAQSDPPGLSDKLEQIAASNADPEVKLKAMGIARELYTAKYADETRAYELHQRQVKLLNDQRESEIVADTLSDNPHITATQISNDPKLNAEGRMRMISFIERQNKPDPLSRVSQQTTMHLLDDMRKPQGDPGRIEDMKPVYDAFTGGQLNRADFDFLSKQFSDVRSPQGEKLAAIQKEFLAGVKPLITRSNPLMGSNDPIGDPNFYMFTWTADQKVQQYRKEGKNPFDLFNPTKPDYLGSPEAVKPYQGTFQQSLEAKTNALSSAPTAPAYPSAPAAPAVTQRQPGESISDYLSRTGAAMPPAPAPAAPPSGSPTPGPAAPIR